MNAKAGTSLPETRLGDVVPAAEEVVARLGEDERLLVIVTPARAPTRPVGCLLVNAGVIHRIGPHRMNVKIARALAARGVVSCRLDLSGLGDSVAATGTASFGDQALLDLKAAMDHMQRTHGLHRFVLFGICSGAVHAYAAALADARLVGIFMFDGYTYSTWKAPWAHRWARWRALLVRELGGKLAGKAVRGWRYLSSVARPADRQTPSDDPRDSPPSPVQYARDMDQLLARGVSIRMAMSGSGLGRYAYANQLRDAFAGEAFVRSVRCDFMPDVDHTITPLAAQAKVIAMIGDWITEVDQDHGVRDGDRV